MNYLKLLELEIKLDNYLSDISEYTQSACNYLINPNSELDKDEIVMYLSSVPECIEYIKELIQKIEEEHEQEERRLENEQLQ